MKCDIAEFLAPYADQLRNEGRKEGRKEGFEQGELNSILNIMRTTGWSMEDTMEKNVYNS